MKAVVTVSLGSSHIFQGCVSLKKILLPECTRFGGYYMLNSVPFTHFYGPKMITAFGDSVGNDACFNINGTGVLILNTALQTCNSGQPDGDLQIAVTRGYSVRYVTNFTPLNIITNLSTGTIYNTTVQLNFTPPTSVNGVDFYEVYLNGERFNSKEIKNSGEFITGLTPATNYNIRIVAVDMFYNKSELSNTVNVSTTNRVATDVDAISYINASSNTIFQDIIDDMFIGFKTQGLYAKIPAFYPFLGTTAAQHKWNAKNPLDTNAAFRLQFFGGGTHSNLGYQCNGTNAYANTFFVPSVNTSVENSGISITSGTNNTPLTTNVIDFGSEQTTPFPGFELALKRRVSKSDVVGYIGTTVTAPTAGSIISTQTDIKGVNTVVSLSLSSRKLFKNKVLLLTDSKSTTASLPTIPAYIGCLNNQGSPFGYSNQRMQFTAIHEGLTDAEVVALHTIIDNFESAIGRKTW